jgi:hypothetical protein
VSETTLKRIRSPLSKESFSTPPCGLPSTTRTTGTSGAAGVFVVPVSCVDVEPAADGVDVVASLSPSSSALPWMSR